MPYKNKEDKKKNNKKWDDCNISIGRMKDNPQTLRNAANYLEKFDIRG